MSKGDFENRDAEAGLGDFPEDLTAERGDLTIIKGNETPLPPDLHGNDFLRKSAKLAGLGSPNLDYNVRGVFDSRPINGIDFNIAVQCPFSAGGGGEGPVVSDPSNGSLFAVPSGFVAVLRLVKFYSNQATAEGPVITNDGAIDFFIGICKNGGIVNPVMMNPISTPPNSTYPLGIPIKAPDEIHTFIIYDEFDTFGVNFTGVPGIYGIPEGFANLKFYGNLLVKTGIPPNMEVANLSGKSAPKPLASMADVYGTQPQQTKSVAPRKQPGTPVNPRRRLNRR